MLIARDRDYKDVSLLRDVYEGANEPGVFVKVEIQPREVIDSSTLLIQWIKIYHYAQF